MNRIQQATAWLRDGALSLTAVLLVLATAASGWSASFISLHEFATAHMTLSSGAATLDATGFALGDNSITANYSGDSNYAAVTSCS